MKKAGSGKALNNDKKYFDIKVGLRLEAFSKTENTKILECFAGDGVLWRQLKIPTTTKIDADERFNVDIIGNSLTYIKKNDISDYGIIDLDSWGTPFKHIETLVKKKYRGVVICTFCSPVNINPCKVLAQNYYGEIYTNITKKSLLCGNEKMIKKYLRDINAKEVKGIITNTKSYFSFTL